jgi:hypothetical protein
MSVLDSFTQGSSAISNIYDRIGLNLLISRKIPTYTRNAPFQERDRDFTDALPYDRFQTLCGSN